MTFADMIILGAANLMRTKLRTVLTTLGVVIGIGALTSMVSFGSGMQKNISDSFASNDLFTSITVTPKQIDLSQLGTGNPVGINGGDNEHAATLNDSMLSLIRDIPGVTLAYPVIDFPARVKILNDSASLSIQAMPAASGAFKPFNNLLAGSFYESDSSDCVILDERILLTRFKIRLIKEGEDAPVPSADSATKIVSLHPDSLIGQKISIVTMAINAGKIPGALFGLMGGQSSLPFDEVVTELTVSGILKQRDQFSTGFLRSGIIIPPITAERIPKPGFTNVMDLLDDKKEQGTYSTVQVRVDNMKRTDEVKAILVAMNLGVFSMADQLDEIKRNFMIFNGILGAIGTIALIVAGLGIANTMVMSILERKREIGIMKAIGASEQNIKTIFLTLTPSTDFVL
jgi:ABC-type antimicrobial peptide transport system permease subunit